MHRLFFLIFSYFSLIWATLSANQFPTYFQYTDQELAPIARLGSSQTLSTNELITWDQNIFRWMHQNNQMDQQARIYAYIFIAQQDFALLSYQLKNRFEGSFTPVTSQTLALFSREQRGQNQRPDAFSNALAALIVSKLNQRLIQDLQGMHDYPFIGNNYFWRQNKPPTGLNIGTWKPWILTSGQSLRVAPPPPERSDFWQDQMRQVYMNCEQRTKRQEEIGRLWRGARPEQLANVNDWRYIGTDYMQKHNVSLPLFVVVRALLGMGLSDTWIAAFDSKYVYWVKRPDMLDPSLKTFGRTPNYPSYPAEYSALSATAATILSYFFPQSKQLWLDLAHESGVSHLWCGLHFPIDHKAGITLGERIGQATLQAFEQTQASK